jgi:hypothetical protein
MLWDMALRGDLAACKLILEYMEGKPLQRVAAALGPLEQPAFTADELARAQEALREIADCGCARVLALIAD